MRLLGKDGRNSSDTMQDIAKRIEYFMEQEARSCSMDFGCLIPEYVLRVLGDSATLEEIERATVDVRRMM